MLARRRSSSAWNRRAAPRAPKELQFAAPPLNGKTPRELTIKLLFDDMADWLSMGSGWFAPITNTLQAEMLSHNLPQRDRVYIRALVKIMRSYRKDSFMETLPSFTGMPQEDKSRDVNCWLASNPAPLSANNPQGERR